MMLDVTDRLIVVVGGGSVAARKVARLLEAGARHVRVVAPQFHPALPSGVERRDKQYDATDLDGAGLVFAATSHPAVNQAVLADARARGVLACRTDADAENPGDFATPALLRRGDVVLTASAGSAALSATIRNSLERKFDPRWSALAAALQSLRPRIQQERNIDDPRRATVLCELGSEAALEVVDRAGESGLWQWVNERLGIEPES